MLARRRNRAEQDFFGRLYVARLQDFRQLGLDQFMLVVKRLLLADLVEAMFQRLHEQVVLRFGVWRVDLVNDGGERFHLGQRFQPGHAGLDVVEQVVEHRVFRPQYVGYFHGAQIGCIKEPVKSSDLNLGLSG